MNGLDIIEYGGEGYKRLVNGAKWTLATLNHAERFNEANFAHLERHNLTDETFVLLSGEATLLIGAEAARVRMEPLKYYNVRAGIWHHIFVAPGTRVLVAENADTSLANSDYLDIRTGKVYQRRPAFEEVMPGIWLLRIPFGPVWTGIILVRGERNFLIDSSHLEPEKYLLPALADLGLAPSDISWLLCTHVHGDHIGGHHALHEKYGVQVATLDSSAEALRDPVKVAIRVRTRFPRNSPPPQSYLKGVEPDRLLGEGDLLEGRFRAVAAPGHDNDCLVWIDTLTGTAFTGDSLQGNGTPTQGIGFYRDLAAYRATLAKLTQLVEAGEIRNLVCGHYYDGIGDIVRGPKAVAEALRYSAERVDLYDKRIAAYVAEGVPIEEEPVTIPRKPDTLRTRYADTVRRYEAAGVDITREPMLVAPAPHTSLGGVVIDEQCRVLRADGTPIPGLFAAGEVTGGVHGLNRIGGNAGTEVLVFGRIAGREAAAFSRG